MFGGFAAVIGADPVFAGGAVLVLTAVVVGGLSLTSMLTDDYPMAAAGTLAMLAGVVAAVDGLSLGIRGVGLVLVVAGGYALYRAIR